MNQSFTVPVSTKLRLCQPIEKTLEFAQRLEHVGASWVTLHARTVSARRRRQGAADLSQVKRLKGGLSIPVVSNGNVRLWDDLCENLTLTGADGLMVGETLLGNPCIFHGPNLPEPVDISLEYLSLCQQYPGTATIRNIQTHIRHFIGFQYSRHPWFNNFRADLDATTTLEEIERLLIVKVERWLSRTPRCLQTEPEDVLESDASCDLRGDSPLNLMLPGYIPSP
ncbi:hypothetical protein AMATHDRAFT_64798 [Amanita thiersii Skay4041]|uniref:DUS-like FMN-binding domain-containing protein n=1 Tax=Amanita thiersii Skay4041 TaxID=703135 RepID=A0A2A9NM02_9AGAR|nr:hypothetical protein AMATHDRAFT_64798 [Amanita thiersii Skay4041]